MKAIACLVLLALAGCQTIRPAGRSACDTPAVRAEARQAIQAFFDALRVDDRAALRRVTSADFAAFDVGQRFTAASLADLIAASHREGRQIEWNLGPMTMEVDCNLVSASWENTGASGTAGRMKPRSWLESAVLRRDAGRLVLAFFHSTPKDPRG